MRTFMVHGSTSGVNHATLRSMALALCIVFIAAPLSAADSTGIEEALRGYIRTNYPWPEIEIDDLTLSDGPTDGLPERILVEKGPPKKTVFRLEFRDGKRITATFNVRAFDRIVMSRNARGKGYCLREDDIYTSLIDATRVPKDAVKDSESVVGKPLTRSIIANTILSEDMVSQTAAVKRGQKVMLVAESGSVNVTTRGEMKESGYVGNYVKALNLSSRKTVTGRLIDENTVKVDF